MAADPDRRLGSMSTVAVLGGLWVLVGFPLVLRYVNDRRSLPMEEFQRAMGALSDSAANGHTSHPSFPRAARRRRLISTLTYVPGAAFAVAGMVLDDDVVMAAGVALGNLGTVHRLAALNVERARRRWARPVLGGKPVAPLSPSVPSLEQSGRPGDPGVDEGPGDAHAGGDGWQIIGPEPRRVDDLVLVDADVS